MTKNKVLASFIEIALLLTINHRPIIDIDSRIEDKKDKHGLVITLPQILRFVGKNANKEGVSISPRYN